MSRRPIYLEVVDGRLCQLPVPQSQPLLREEEFGLRYEVKFSGETLLWEGPEGRRFEQDRAETEQGIAESWNE